MRSLADREEAWRRLADMLGTTVLDDIAEEITLAQVIDTANKLLDGEVRGRVVVDENR